MRLRCRQLTIAITMFCFMIFAFSPLAYAQITRKVDQFDGTVTINSEVRKNTGQFTSIHFTKFYTKNKEPFYALYFYAVKGEWWFFARDYMEYKIDNDDTIYKAKVNSTKSTMISAYSLLTSCIIDVTPDMVTKLSNSNQVVMRVYFNNRPAVVWTVAPEILAEWKTVINTNADGTIEKQNSESL